MSEFNKDQTPDDSLQSGDALKADVEKALLAAFGEDAIGWLDEDEALELELRGSESLDSEDMLDQAPGEGSVVDDDSLTSLLERITAAMMGTRNANSDEVDHRPRYVVFEVAGKQFGVPLESALEIERRGKVTPLPRTPSWLRGVTNLRGEILSVTDFRELLGMDDQRRAVGERIIVVQSQRLDSRTALVVDRVLGIRHVDFQSDPFQETSDRVAAFAEGYTMIDQAATVLVDPDLLLGSNELAAFAS